MEEVHITKPMYIKHESHSFISGDQVELSVN